MAKISDKYIYLEIKGKADHTTPKWWDDKKKCKEAGYDKDEHPLSKKEEKIAADALRSRKQGFVEAQSSLGEVSEIDKKIFKNDMEILEDAKATAKNPEDVEAAQSLLSAHSTNELLCYNDPDFSRKIPCHSCGRCPAHEVEKSSAVFRCDECKWTFQHITSTFGAQESSAKILALLKDPSYDRLFSQGLHATCDVCEGEKAFAVRYRHVGGEHKYGLLCGECAKSRCEMCGEPGASAAFFTGEEAYCPDCTHKKLEPTLPLKRPVSEDTGGPPLKKQKTA